MTREEAIKNIKEHCYFANLIPPAKEALDMAIIALQQEPCGDDVLDKIRAEIVEEAKGTMNENRADGLYKALQIVKKHMIEGSEE